MAKQNYYDLLDALNEHPTFANCEDRGCIKCAHIKQIGEKAWGNNKGICEINIDEIEFPDNLKDFTVEQYEQLKSEGILDKQMQQKMGVLPTAFGRWKKQVGASSYAKVTAGLRKIIIERIDAGDSLIDIATDVGMSLTTVSKVSADYKQEKVRGVK